MLQTIDECLWDGAKLMLVSCDTLCLGIECLGATYKQVGAAKFLPTVPLAEQLACTLVHDEVNHAVLVTIATNFRKNSLIFCGKLLVILNLEVGSGSSALDTC